MFPGLAVAGELRARGHEVVVVFSGRGAEASRSASALPEGAEPMLVPVRPLRPRDPLSVPLMLVGVVRAVCGLRRRRPDALLAMGSYTSFAPVVAARLLGIPVALHEANAIPGSAVAALRRLARLVCLAFPDAAAHLPGVETTDTGLPVRAEFSHGLGGSAVPAGRVGLLVMGGSQGARALNALAVGAIVRLRDAAPDIFRRLRVTHLVGPANVETVSALYRDAGLENDTIHVIGFSNEMPRHYAEASFCLSRAGASSCFELALAGLPALLVPLPGLARDHQAFNARAMAARGAAEWRPQGDLSPESLARDLATLAGDNARLAAMRKAMLSVACPDAAARVADAMENLAARR